MYNIFGNFDGDLIVYKNDVFFIRIVRMQFWSCTKRGQVFDAEGKIILEYSHFEFFYTKIKILHQNLPLKISLTRNTLTNYNLNVGKATISIKFKPTALSKTLCNIYVNNVNIATVKRKVFALENDIDIFVKQENDYDLYIILLLIMSITTLDA